MKVKLHFILIFILFLSCSIDSNKKLLGVISLAKDNLLSIAAGSMQYPSSLIFYVNAKVNITPTVQGTVSSYSISPNLPAGISIDTSTGKIQGTPTSATSALDYTVTSGALSSKINIQVKSITATRVYGQLGDFTTGTANKGGISADSLNSPRNCSIDKDDNLYVADTDNNRVLFYPKGSTTATRVYGQLADFTSTAANNGGRSANTLDSPRGVYVDSNNIVYIADTSNDRVLVYENNSTTASKVFGQQNGFTTGTTNFGGLSAQSLSDPRGIVRDRNNLLYIFDTNNNRLLSYSETSTTAIDVIGQNNIFTTNTSGLSASKFDSPFSVVFDSSNNLYVADLYNNRVLFFPSNQKTATVVYGQQGSFTSNTTNNGGVSSISLDSPIGVQIDKSNGLYVADGGNNRVLFFPENSTAATIVFGQNNSFTSNTANNGGLSATSLNNPRGVCIDSSGGLYVVDDNNNRVLYF